MTEILTNPNVITEEDFRSADWEDTITWAGDGTEDPVIGERLQPKFDSVAAFKLHRLTLDSMQDEDHGSAIDWNRWSALFRNVTDSDSPLRSEQPAAMLHTDSQGFVSAEWYGDGNAAEEVWSSLEKEWEDFEEESEGSNEG